MDPAFLAVLEKNEADMTAIVALIGIANLLKCLPHIKNILETYNAAKARKP